mgnify:CR=1 FL=1
MMGMVGGGICVCAAVRELTDADEVESQTVGVEVAANRKASNEDEDGGIASDGHCYPSSPSKKPCQLQYCPDLWNKRRDGGNMDNLQSTVHKQCNATTSAHTTNKREGECELTNNGKQVMGRKDSSGHHWQFGFRNC